MKITTLTPFQFRMATTVIFSVCSGRASIDEAYSDLFAKVKVNGREQALIHRVTGDIFRRLNYYCAILHIQRKDIPTPENVDKLVHLWHIISCQPQPYDVRTEALDIRDIKSSIHDLRKDRALVDGCPNWLDERGFYELGDRWPQERYALWQAPSRYIRANTLKTTRDDLIKTLKRSEVHTRPVEGVPDALEVLSDASLFKLHAFQNGLFEQQDAGSQLIAPFLDIKPGMRIIDACAGSGGKTMHLAALSKGKGQIIAMDVADWKLKQLRGRAARDGAFNIETRLIDSTKAIKRLKNSADRLLLDVPCSGLGVLKRNPDIKWADTPSRLNNIYKTQTEILDTYTQMVKPGGKFVYSTCSILPIENNLRIRAFLKKHAGEFILEEERTIYPSETGFDGFYMARLAKISSGEQDGKEGKISVPSSDLGDATRALDEAMKAAADGLEAIKSASDAADENEALSAAADAISGPKQKPLMEILEEAEQEAAAADNESEGVKKAKALWNK